MSASMGFDRVFSWRIAVFNTIGFLVAVLTPIIVDPLLTTQRQFGERHYPYGLLTLLLSPIVLVSTYLLLRRGGTQIMNRVCSCLGIGIIGGICSFVFPPERPHLGVLVTTFCYAFVSFLTVFLHQNLDNNFSYVEDLKLPYESRMERLKATTTTWQWITIYGSSAWLAFVVFWVSIVWSALSPAVVLDPSERVIFANVLVLQICILSLVVIAGPLNEAFAMTMLATRHLSCVKRSNQESLS